MLANGSTRKTPASDKQKKTEPVHKIDLPMFVRKILKECALAIPPNEEITIGPGKIISVGEAIQTLRTGTKKTIRITYAGGVPTKMVIS